MRMLRPVVWLLERTAPGQAYRRGFVDGFGLTGRANPLAGQGEQIERLYEQGLRDGRQARLAEPDRH